MVPSLQMHIDLVQGLQIVIPQVLETLDQLHGIQLLSLIRDFYLQVDIDFVQGLHIIIAQIFETFDHLHGNFSFQKWFVNLLTPSCIYILTHQTSYVNRF